MDYCIKTVSPPEHRGACAAVALHHALNVPYDEAVNILRTHTDFGNGKAGTNVFLFKVLLQSQGWAFKPVYAHIKKLDPKKLPDTCILLFSRHVATFKDGMVQDQFVTERQAGCKIVKGIWYRPEA